MAAIKSFTDLPQSKVLAEFLPLESADMSWVSNGLGKPFARTIPIKGDPEELCACWSLAALLNVLPEPELIQTSEGKWLVRCWTKIRNPWSVGGYSNPIDACVEMILKLHELELL